MAAIDQHERAEACYRANFDHPWWRRNVLGLKPAPLEALDAHLWWLSPPCQPYTVRGARRDLDDPRAASLVHVLGLIEAVRPPRVAMENVPPFAESRARARVVSTLDRLGYAVQERVWCPTELGVAGQRSRYYLAAGRSGLRPWASPPSLGRALSVHLDEADDPALAVPAPRLARFEHALHVVDRDDPHAIAACFTSAYGRSPVYAGSYLRSRRQIRHLHPREILRLLGFPPSYTLPHGLTLRHGWDLVGNSLSVDVVREVIATVR